MAIQLPSASDKQNSPSHSALHRVVAVDSAAAEQSLVVEADSTITATNGLKIASLSGVLKASTGTVSGGSALDDLSDVIVSSPTVDQVIKYNGAEWINGPESGVAAGPGIGFYYDDTVIIAAGAGPQTVPLYTLSKTPSALVEDTDSVTVNVSDTYPLLLDRYLYNTALGGTQIDAGTWTFHTYNYVDTNVGVTTMPKTLYKVVAGAGTVTITGSGTSRTATVSGGTPFVAGNANADPTLSGYLQTPNGIFQITGFTSTSVVTITTLSTYTNESTVAYSVHNFLFLCAGTEINNVAVALNTGLCVQPAFAINSTDKLAIAIFAKTTRNGNVLASFVHGGTTNYSHFITPLVTRHNDLAGLQGGSASERYHLTAAQNTVVGNTSGTNTGDQDLSALTTAPTELKLSVASKGGVFNGGFELGVGGIDKTVGGWIEDEKYGWYHQPTANNMSARFDTTVSKNGGKSLKLSTVDATGTGNVALEDMVGTYSEIRKHTPQLKPSTKYRFSADVKTYNVATNAVYITLFENSTGGAGNTPHPTSKLSGTNDWTKLSVEFTTASNAENARILCCNDVAGNVGNAWFDNIQLEEIITDTTFTGKIAEKIRAVFQGVTSTDNIDQSLDTGGAYANTYALTNAVNEGATHIQTFTPTKKHTTQIGVWCVATGTGVDWTLVVHDSGNVIVASKLIAAASLVAGQMNYFDVPNIWASGALHFHLYASATTGTPTCKANTSDDLETASFIQRYAKKTETFSLITNGIKTELKTDKDGVLNGAIIDLDNRKYKILLDYRNVLTSINDVFSASAGADAGAASGVINGWSINSSLGGFIRASGATKPIVWKVNTLAPIKHLKFKQSLYSYSATARTLQISSDNTNWITVISDTLDNSQMNESQGETDLMNGLNSFYIKIVTADTNIALMYVDIEADLDTSKLPQGLFYPIATNQFTETIKLPANATRAYFRLNKFENENKVLMPAIEYTDASGNYIGYTSLKLDNSQETNPAIALVDGTTGGQQVGTGSAESNYYILNDGEYMTMSAAASELKVIYKVGKGTTAFTNITKNTYYVSSNGDSDDATQDPSHQCNVIIGARQQGLLQVVGDIRNEIQDVKKGVADTQQLVRNNSLIVGFDNGTTDDYVITLPDFKGYATGMSVLFKANTVNTGACTLNINGMGAKAIVKGITTALSNADILALMWCQCVYDGVAFVLLNPRAL